VNHWKTLKTTSFLKENADYIDDIMPGSFNLHKEGLILKDPGKWNIAINEDGSYINKKGVSVKESGSFHRAFQAKRAIGSIRVPSRKFSFHYDGHVAKILYFLRNCYHPISGQETKKSLGNKNPEQLFPMIFGKIEERNGTKILSIIDVTRFPVINKCFPMKQRAINDIEQIILGLDNFSIFRNMLRLCYARKKQVFQAFRPYRKPNSD